MFASFLLKVRIDKLAQVTELRAGVSDAEKTIERVWQLNKMNDGPVGYYCSLLESANEVIAVGAANILLDQKQVPHHVRSKITELSKYASVRFRAFQYFMGEFDHDHAKQVRDQITVNTEQAIQKFIEATYTDDYGLLYEAEIERFYRTGEVDCLYRASIAAESKAGWKEALSITVDLILINPQNVAWPLRLGQLLVEANQFELLEKFCGLIDGIEIFPNVSLLLQSEIAVNKRDYNNALGLLDRVNVDIILGDVKSSFFHKRAGILEKLGRYEEAYKNFVKQNKELQKKGFDPTAFEKRCVEVAKSTFMSSADPHSNYFQMLGFPRSGTTLLENILSSHPAIETFEEIPSWTAVMQLRDMMKTPSFELPSSFSQQANKRYYEEINRRRHKQDASIFIDKMPIQSAHASFMKKLFPEKRYIFSIRHPFDVVLSCFKQNFTNNIAMEAFTTFEDSCRRYDFVMSQWFGVYNLSSPEVCYVRYDDLVTDLKPTAERVLAFLGVEWVDSIQDFAKNAEDRKVRTPSYAKVRQGLSIGVQSSWAKYDFLFKRKEARVLDKWVAFFGYTGL